MTDYSHYITKNQFQRGLKVPPHKQTLLRFMYGRKIILLSSEKHVISKFFAIDFITHYQISDFINELKADQQFCKHAPIKFY